MNKTTITSPKGIVIFMDRQDADRQGIKYSIPSSTEAHPLVSVHLRDGKQVGACAQAVSQLEKILAAAKKEGWVVTDGWL